MKTYSALLLMGVATAFSPSASNARATRQQSQPVKAEGPALADAVAHGVFSLAAATMAAITLGVAPAAIAAEMPADVAFPFLATTTMTMAAKSAGAAPEDLSIRLGSLPFISGNTGVLTVDLPKFGKLDVSVTVSKSAKTAPPADLQIALPKDLIKATQDAIGGKFGLDVSGPIISGHANANIINPRTGGLDISIQSENLIQKLPALPPASSKGNGKEASEWWLLRNLGSEATYYANLEKGISQDAAPKLK